jgi:hypothetical protein
MNAIVIHMIVKELTGIRPQVASFALKQISFINHTQSTKALLRTVCVRVSGPSLHEPTSNFKHCTNTGEICVHVQLPWPSSVSCLDLTGD